MKAGQQRPKHKLVQEPNVVVNCLICRHLGTGEVLSRSSIGPKAPIAAFINRMRSRRALKSDGGLLLTGTVLSLHDRR
jgi:hypothetical protein